MREEEAALREAAGKMIYDMVTDQMDRELPEPKAVFSAQTAISAMVKFATLTANPGNDEGVGEASRSRGFNAGLDHIANFINALDSEGMTAKDVRTAIYGECLVAALAPADEPAKVADEAVTLANGILALRGDDHEIERITIGGLKTLARVVLATLTPETKP